MITKDDLIELRWLDRRIEKLHMRITRLRETREGASSWSFGRARGGSGPRDLMAEYAGELETLEGELTARVIELERKRIVAEAALECLDAKYRQVLQLYYIENLAWIEVAEEVNYSAAHCRRLRDEALCLLAG